MAGREAGRGGAVVAVAAWVISRLLSDVFSVLEAGGELGEAILHGRGKRIRAQRSSSFGIGYLRARVRSYPYSWPSRWTSTRDKRGGTAWSKETT